MLFRTIFFVFLTTEAHCCLQNTFEGTRLSALQDIALKDEIADFNFFTKASTQTILPIYQAWGCIMPDDGFSNVVAIQIREENVPVFYEGAIQSLPWLHSIHVISCGVTRLEPGAFQNLPSLRIVKIQDNNISTIPDHVFNNLMVQKLILTFNQIEHIHPAAFNDMPKLESIKLDFNRLASWDTDWFWNCPQVRYLSVKFNQMTFVPGKAFRNVEATLQRLYLSHNEISDISGRAFTGLKRLTDLSLQGNENVTSLDELSFLYLENLRVIDLSDTGVSCLPDALLNTLRSDVLLWIDNVPLNASCLVILKQWAVDNRNDLKFYEKLKNVTEGTKS